MLIPVLPPLAIKAIYAILVAINVVAFVVYGIDKKRATHDEWRIPEATLLTLAAAFGAVGALSGMYTFRHKTRKPKFAFGVPLLMAAQLAVFWLLFLR
ncbi:MAG: DUF1294 domain-containing protein [Clostridia bacterium]|nr:DUF1294 domain-containing protein [Clostridia bacterium]MBQ1529621.1 DUF1294 domain-containing protein [Clostridia bacterium]MBQ5581050.1 DUF1294 domain-containing protein [Clostridia bacterium]